MCWDPRSDERALPTALPEAASIVERAALLCARSAARDLHPADGGFRVNSRFIRRRSPGPWQRASAGSRTGSASPRATIAAPTPCFQPPASPQPAPSGSAQGVLSSGATRRARLADQHMKGAGVKIEQSLHDGCPDGRGACFWTSHAAISVAVVTDREANGQAVTSVLRLIFRQIAPSHQACALQISPDQCIGSVRAVKLSPAMHDGAGTPDIWRGYLGDISAKLCFAQLSITLDRCWQCFVFGIISETRLSATSSGR